MLPPQLDTIIQQHQAHLVGLRHDLHAHPQLAFHETYASQVVQNELKALGIPFQAGLAETGVVAWIGEGAPAVALRADMDALPITEQTRLPYASQHPGLMHACGHDGHTTVLLGVARVLQEMRDQLPRPVKLLFQPGEEGAGGARHMIEAGALTAKIGGSPVRSVFGLHGMPYLKVGQFATRAGAFMAATHDFHINVIGRGGHAAIPQHAVDPVPAAAQLILALQTVISRNLDPADQAVLSVTQVRAASDAVNVIASQVKLGGTFRTISPRTADLIGERVKRLASSITAAHGGRADVNIVAGYPVTMNDPAAAALALEVAREQLGDSGALEAPSPIMGAEDFAFYSQQVPACFGFIGTCPLDREDYPPLHHPEYDFNDDSIQTGIKLMVAWALRGGV